MSDLRLLSIQRPEGPVRGARGHDGKPARLLLSTSKGALRVVPVTRDDLLKLAESAIAVVRFMDREGS